MSEVEKRARCYWLMTQAGRHPGNPHELLPIVTVRQIVRELWPDVAPDWQILTLSKAGFLSLHEHDFPSGVPDQSTLLRIRGHAYCGAALRN